MLLHGVVGDRFSIGRQDLKVVKASVHAVVSPNNLFVSRDFEQLHAVTLGVVTGYHGVPVR